MERYDIAIVGAGITGCAIARQLSRYDISLCVLESGNDVALGASKANGGLVHAGYDPAPHTVKATVNARGCELYGAWSRELGFTFHRTGSLVVGFTSDDRERLMALYRNGIANGVDKLPAAPGHAEELRFRIIDDAEDLHELEPRVSDRATCGLWCAATGVVDPFEVAIAAAENAAANGVGFLMGTRVRSIHQANRGFEIETDTGSVGARYLINAAGSGCADISRMAGGEKLELDWRQGNIVILDKEPRPFLPLYPVPTPVSKGVIVAGTVHGNTVITATARLREPGDDDTYAQDVEELLEGARRLVPDLDTKRVVRPFAGGRAVIKGMNDFLICRSHLQPRLFQAAGMQSPGVASAPAVAERMERLLREAGIELRERASWNPIRKAPVDFDLAEPEEQDRLIADDPAWGHIFCRCETVPEAEVVAAIRRVPGARSVEGVKRRCRAGMGRCQGGFCQSRVVAVLARELGCNPSEVPLEDVGSPLLYGTVKGDARDSIAHREQGADFHG